jgi:hypothetical protein
MSVSDLNLELVVLCMRILFNICQMPGHRLPVFNDAICQDIGYPKGII